MRSYTPFQDTIQAIVDAAGRTADFAGEDFHLKVEAPGFMPLTIEAHGTGQNRRISVTHYYEQNGDLVPDPDVIFNGDFYPLEITHATGWRSQVAFYEGGKLMIRPAAKRDLDSFLRVWAKNLKAQGFVKAARHLGRATAPAGR